MQDEKNIAKMVSLICKIESYTKDLDFDGFAKDDMLVEACVFNLAQLGEVAHKVSNEIISLHPEIAWNDMYGLRNRLVHDYEGVKPIVVWEIISIDLPVLRSQLENIF